jgi:uncharacterized Fe-S cluster-containing MiaB family protein
MRSFSEITLSSDGRIDSVSKLDTDGPPAPVPPLIKGGKIAPVPQIVPRAENLFDPVRDRYGCRLALVFGNHAPGGLCPYVAVNRCFHCDIGSGEGAASDHAANRARLAFFRDHYGTYLGSINHLVLYNSGSLLNPREMPRDLLAEILAFARSLPAVRIISIDSREAYITPVTLERVLDCVGNGHVVDPILGVETADDRIRNEVLQKAMPRTAIARVFRDISHVAKRRGRERLGVDVNIVIAGPGTTPETAIDDAVETARFALGLGLEHGIKVDLNIMLGNEVLCGFQITRGVMCRRR